MEAAEKADNQHIDMPAVERQAEQQRISDEIKRKQIIADIKNHLNQEMKQRMRKKAQEEIFQERERKGMKKKIQQYQTDLASRKEREEEVKRQVAACLQQQMDRKTAVQVNDKA